LAYGEFLVFSQVFHVDVSIGLHPAFVSFDGERPDQSQTALGVWEDAHDIGSAAGFLVFTPASLPQDVM